MRAWIVALPLAACATAPSVDERWPIEPAHCAHVARPAAVPYVGGELERVFVPPGTRYVNDHSLVRGPDGWHLYGITHDSIGMPLAETTFLHATAPDPRGPWTAQRDVLVADPSLGEHVLWAPHVVEIEA